jgi:hypothetical protein
MDAHHSTDEATARPQSSTAASSRERHPAHPRATSPRDTPARPERPRAQQIPLLDLDAHPEWFLDEFTRDIGRVGVAQARAALRASRRRTDDVEADATAA